MYKPTQKPLLKTQSITWPRAYGIAKILWYLIVYKKTTMATALKSCTPLPPPKKTNKIK